MLHQNVISGDYPTVLALDLGNPFGWAYNSGTDIESGVMTYSKESEEFMFMRWLNNFLNSKKVAAVIFENAAYQPANAIQRWHSQRGIMAAVCQSNDVAYGGIDVGTWKKHIVGFANFTKPTRKAERLNYMVIKALAIRAIIVEDHNAADAIGVLLTALETGVVEGVGE